MNIHHAKVAGHNRLLVIETKKKLSHVRVPPSTFYFKK